MVLSKKAIEFDLEYCPECDYMVSIPKGQTLEDHLNERHSKGWKDPGFEAIEKFEYQPYDEPSTLESLFKDCPKCGAEMDIFEAETNQYWVCEKCGHNERMGEPTKPTWKDYLKPSHWLKQIKDVVGGYPKRREVLADQMTPNIWLGDVINAWVMRDKKSGKPFDAILNVSQHSYTPPEDVEYSHIPIDEYNPSKEARKKRIRDITKAAGLLDKWTQEGKKIYLHCSEGMNRSPSVLAAHLFNEQMQDAKNQGLTTDDKEALYDLVIEDIGRKRFVAMPYGEMEDSLREYLGFPPPQRRPVTKEEIDRIFQRGGPTKGGWFAPEKRPKPKFRLNEQVHWEYGNKPHTGTIISTPQFGDQGGVYWIKDQESGVVAMVKEEMLRRKKKIEPVRYYPGEKGIIQTHPKFPPPGGVSRRKKRKGFLSKGSFVKTALHGNAFRTVARFIRRAIRRDELYNFYAVMQLPPAFFAAFPKWDSYARGLVETVAAEYAKYLEQIVRTEAESTHAQLGGDDEESEHDHEWEPYDEDEHRCSDCGYGEAHYGWSDADETGHTCEVCGHANSHSFDTDHECTECGGSYVHNWALVGDQEYRCESTDDAYGDLRMGCGAETDTIPADEEAPFYGDFWEERHQHNFQDYPITEQRGSGDAVRCNLCGRAFVDELGEVTERLPGIQKKRVTSPSSEYLYREMMKEQEEKVKNEHENNPNLHEFKFVKVDNYAKWNERDGYLPANIYVCQGCGETLELFGEDQPQVGKLVDRRPQPTKQDWQTVVLSGKCPSCSPTAAYPIRLIDTGNGYRCPSCSRNWDYQGNSYTPGSTQGRALSIRQLVAQPLRRQRELFKPKAPREIPRINIDTSKWFDFHVQDPDGSRWIPWSELRSTFKPSQWRLFEQSLIDNPESILTYLTPSEGGLREQVDREKLDKFKFLVQLKRNLLGIDKEEVKKALSRFQQYAEYLRTDADDIFLAIFGLKALYDTKSPDEKDSIILNEIQKELPHAWKNYLAALGEVDPEAAAFYERYQEPPKPEWSAQAESLANRVVIAKGTGTSPGVATGRIAITAAMAMEFAASGSVILVRPETTPEDIAAMKAAAGFLTAHGGPTAHAAIVARQMGKPCITGAGFTLNGDVVTFPGGRTIEVGNTITIDGRSGAISVAETAEEATEPIVEEKHVEPPQPGEDWDDQFEKLLALDKLVEQGKEKYRDYDYEDLSSMDLSDLAQTFASALHAGPYGGPRWALAAIRAKQLQESINLEMPWRYQGMIVDQINTLQHNSGNIFYAKPWPGSPDSWINDVLDTKGSEHAMWWMEQEKADEDHPVFTDEVRQMLRDYRMWARREGYPSLYGTDISNLTPEQMEELKEREKNEVRTRRNNEAGKWAHRRRSQIVVTKQGNTITAFHKISGARLVVYADIDHQEVHKLDVPERWKGRGIASRLATAIQKCPLT